jgi:hypothetical protein
MPKKTVTQLYTEFEKAVAAVDAMRRSAEDEEFAAVLDAADRLCRRIVTTPANQTNPIPEMLMKIDAADWRADMGHDETNCLASLRKDLKAMQAARPRAARRPARAAAAAPSR